MNNNKNKNHKIQFGTLSPEGKLSNVRYIRQGAIMKCPQYILVPEHYREDETCRCNDLTHVEMLKWGYEWDGKQWFAPKLDPEGEL